MGVLVRRTGGVPAGLPAVVVLAALVLLALGVLLGTGSVPVPNGGGPAGAIGAAGATTGTSDRLSGATGGLPASSPDGAAGGDARTTPGDSGDRARQVAALLDGRAAALLARDREGFLAGIDPAAAAFRERQGALFDALAGVPLATWRYELDGARAHHAAGLGERHGAEVWVPQVVLRYSFAGVPGRPSVAAQVLTFVDRGGRWLLASDSDLDDGPFRTARALWDSGPVVAVRGRHSLVLAHPESRPALAGLAAEVDAAVPRVTAVWGSGWVQHVVVVVPADEREMRLLVGDGMDLAGIAAVATAQLAGGPHRYDPVGDCVVVHPGNYPGLGALGKRIVLSHEVAHVASRQASGPALPAWLAEGLADHVAYGDAGIPLDRAAPRTARAVRSGQVPDALPTEDDFAGAEIAAAYEASWLAVLHLAERHGQDALLRLYRRIGAAPPGGDHEAVVVAAFADVLGTTPEAFTAGWRDDLRRRFG